MLFVLTKRSMSNRTPGVCIQANRGVLWTFASHRACVFLSVLSIITALLSLFKVSQRSVV